jgi:putative RNA 2'-phosphotransferase
MYDVRTFHSIVHRTSYIKHRISLMEPEKVVKISRKLSKILRHQPDMIGLNLDKNGWADVAELMQKFGDIRLDDTTTAPLSIEILKEVVATNDKQRFAFNDDLTKIRANQGHSVEIDLALKAVEPPPILFHGTATKNIQSIKNQGLIKGSRQYVHLSIDETTAKKVGSRHGVPVVIKVKTGAMHAAQYMFYQSDNGVWLTDHVPPQYLTFNG